MTESDRAKAQQVHDRTKTMVRNWAIIEKNLPKTTVEDHLEQTSVQLGVYQRCNPAGKEPEFIEILAVRRREGLVKPELLDVEYCVLGKKAGKRPRKIPLFGPDGFLTPVRNKKGYSGRRFQKVSIDKVRI